MLKLFERVISSFKKDRPIMVVDTRNNTWGHAFYIDSTDNGILKGHGFDYNIETGTLMIVANNEGSHLYELTQFKPCSDPRDMFFYEAKFIPLKDITENEREEIKKIMETY